MPQYECFATNIPDSDPFLRAYLECAEWVGIIDEEEREKFERALAPKWSRAALATARAECRDFQWYCAAAGIELGDPTQDGHDFYLTRNGHGAGFWDRGYGPRGDALTKAAHTFGSADVWFDSRRARLHFC